MAYIAKLTNKGGVKSLNRYVSMLAGNDAFVDGNYESIATLTGTGSPGSLTFSSIPQTYTHLQLRGIVRSAGVASQIYTRLNGDGANNYATHYMYTDGSVLSNPVGGTGGAPTSVNLFGGMLASTDTANVHGSFVIDFLDYRDTNKYKSSINMYAADLNGGSNQQLWLSSSVWMNTAAVTSLTVVANAAYTSSTKFYLYGIK